MKTLPTLALALAVTGALLLGACASDGPPGSPAGAGSALPDGTYAFRGFAADGRQTGGPVKVFIPRSNPDVAVMALCMNPGTVTVRATNEAGVERASACGAGGQSAPPP